MTRVIVLLLVLFSLANLSHRLPKDMVEGATIEAIGARGGGSRGRVPFLVGAGAGAGAAAGGAAAGAGNAGTFPPRARPSDNSAAARARSAVAGTSTLRFGIAAAIAALLITQ